MGNREYHEKSFSCKPFVSFQLDCLPPILQFEFTWFGARFVRFLAQLMKHQLLNWSTTLSANWQKVNYKMHVCWCQCFESTSAILMRAEDVWNLPKCMCPIPRVVKRRACMNHALNRESWAVSWATISSEPCHNRGQKRELTVTGDEKRPIKANPFSPGRGSNLRSSACKSNSLTRRYKSRLVPQVSTSVLYI